MSEPLWARNKSIPELRKVCRMFQVKGDIDTWDRKQLIKSCDYLVVFPQFNGDLDILQKKCAKSKEPSKEIREMTQDQLVNCIVNNRTEMFSKIMNVPKQETLKKDLESWGIPEKEQQEILKVNEEGAAGLNAFFAKEVMDDKTFDIVSIFSKQIQTAFARDFQEVIRLVESVKNDTDLIKNKIETNNATWWDAAGKVVKAVGASIYKAGAKIFDVIKFIITNPYIAKIIALIALRVKRSICREISIKFGYVQYIKSKTTWQKAKEYAGSAYENVTEMIPEIASNFLNSEKYSKMVEQVKTITTGSITTALSFLPFVGGPITGFICNLVFDVLEESAREAMELALYVNAISTTATRLIELFDVTNCIKVHTVEDDEKANAINLSGKWEQVLAPDEEDEYEKTISKPPRKIKTTKAKSSNKQSKIKKH